MGAGEVRAWGGSLLLKQSTLVCKQSTLVCNQTTFVEQPPLYVRAL